MIHFWCALSLPVQTTATRMKMNNLSDHIWKNGTTINLVCLHTVNAHPHFCLRHSIQNNPISKPVEDIKYYPFINTAAIQHIESDRYQLHKNIPAWGKQKQWMVHLWCALSLPYTQNKTHNTQKMRLTRHVTSASKHASWSTLHLS